MFETNKIGQVQGHSNRQSTRRRSSALRGAVAACAVGMAFVGLMAGPQVQAQTVIQWSPTAASTSWTTASNWIGGVAPANNLTGNIASFDQMTYLNTPQNVGINIAGLVFGDGTTATGRAGIYGNNTVNIGASGITMNANAGPAEVNFIIGLGASQTWTNNSSNALVTPATLSSVCVARQAGSPAPKTIANGVAALAAARQLRLQKAPNVASTSAHPAQPASSPNAA